MNYQETVKAKAGLMRRLKPYVEKLKQLQRIPEKTAKDLADIELLDKLILPEMYSELAVLDAELEVHSGIRDELFND